MNVFVDEELEVSIPEKGSAADLAEKLNLRDPSQAIAANVNGKDVDLSTELKEGDRVIFWSFNDPKGQEIFWHSSAHVLAQAILRLWPEAKPTIGPPIENGFYYDFANLTVSEEDFPQIEKEVQKIIKENYRPIRHVLKNKEEALERFADNPYKCELINEFEDPLITGYSQGEFFDLCRGPHLGSLGKIKAFKVLKTSGAYWRADQSREMLTRVYAISFPDRKLLKEYLFRLEEAKKRDHKIIGPKLGLFSLKEQAPGIPFLHPRGMVVWNQLVDFWRELHYEANYLEIKTPQLMSRDLWEQSGHWEHYRENMYAFSIEEREFAIKPMNCPGCMLYYKSELHSYREFPLRIAELGHVHRHEPSGALSGLFRVRGFHQDDAHIFMQPSDIKDEILNVLNLADITYGTFGLEYRFELSTRPEKSIGSDEEWEVATRGLQEALDEYGKPYQVNEGDGAFYGPKIDLHIKDALGRSWQCGTIQLDMSLPERFDLEYRDSDGSTKRPVMIHRAIFGSVERFMGILIEHFAGRFPLWISPLQVRLLTVADRHVEYAKKIREKLYEEGFICDIDDTQESISKKVRNAQLLQVNYMLTIGDKEVEAQNLSLRSRDFGVYGAIDLQLFLDEIKKERAKRSLKSAFLVPSKNG